MISKIVFFDFFLHTEREKEKGCNEKTVGVKFNLVSVDNDKI